MSKISQDDFVVVMNKVKEVGRLETTMDNAEDIMDSICLMGAVDEFVCLLNAMFNLKNDVKSNFDDDEDITAIEWFVYEYDFGNRADAKMVVNGTTYDIKTTEDLYKYITKAVTK